MLRLSCLIVLNALVAARAAPAVEELSHAVNRTLCPTVVKYDIKENRIPRVIKTIGCEEDPDDACAKMRGTGECCRSYSCGKVVTDCVEVVDSILVTEKATGRRYWVPIPVGCFCIMEEVKESLNEP